MTTWNSADKDAGVTLSGGDLIATGSGIGGGVRATTSKSSGKNSFAVSSNFTGDATLVAGVTLAGADRTFADADGVGVLYFAAGGGWFAFSNSTPVAGPDGSSPAPTGTDTVVVHVDSGSNLIYFTANGSNLFGGNPAAGTGGIAIPSGAQFADVWVSSGKAATADFSPGSLPSGFSAWDGGGGGSSLTPSLFTDADTFFAPTVVGPRVLTPSLFTNSNSFFAPSVVNRGDLIGTLQANNNTIPTNFSATGSVAVSVGDLIASVVCQQTNLTVTGVTDNLGNTYTAQNAGTDAGNVTGRVFYSRVTNAGTLTSVTAACTTSANDGVHIVGVWKGPFGAIDANVANITSDVTSPYSCPSSGTLSQADEIVIGWGVASYGTSWATSSPSTQAIQLANSTTIKAALNYRVVSSTSAVAPAFTAASNPGQAVLGTLSFTLAAGSATQNLDPPLLTNSQSFYGPTITTGAVDLAPSLFTNSQSFYGPTALNLNTIAPALVTNTQTFYDATVTAGEVTLTPSLFTNTQTFFGPTVTAGEVTLSPSLYTNAQAFYGPVVSQGGVILVPDLLTNTQTFYGPTVTRGAVDLAPSLFTNGQTFFGPTVVGGGTVELSPSLVVNDQTFFAPTVSLAVIPDTTRRGGASYFTQEELRRLAKIEREKERKRREFDKELTETIREAYEDSVHPEAKIERLRALAEDDDEEALITMILHHFREARV